MPSAQVKAKAAQKFALDYYGYKKAIEYYRTALPAMADYMERFGGSIPWNTKAPLKMRGRVWSDLEKANQAAIKQAEKEYKESLAKR